MLRNILEGLKNLSITTLKNVGCGVAFVGARDQFFEDNPMNFVITAVGAVCWMTGVYLEIRRPPEMDGYVSTVRETFCQSTSRVMRELDSTSVMKQSLSHTGGIGVAAGIINFAKRHDTVSANLGSISAGLFMPVVIQELENAEVGLIPPLKWERLRFLVLVGADYLSSAGMKKWVNGEHMNLFDIFSIPVGMLASVGEFIYSVKKDTGLNLASAINRRTIKLCASLNFIYTFIDFIQKNNDKYTLSDDVYALMSGSLMFLAIYQMRWLSLQSSQQLLQQPQDEQKQPLERSVVLSIGRG